MPLIMGILAQGVAAPPAAAGAYDLLETEILTGTTATVTFSSLGSYASDYQHLQLRIVAGTNRSGAQDDYLQLQFNNVTTSSYAWHNLNGTGSTVTSSAFASQTYMRIANASLAGGSFASYEQSGIIVDILDPFNSSKNTTVRALAGSPGYYLNLNSGLFNSTASITEIDLFGVSSSFVATSRFSLYGLKAA